MIIILIILMLILLFVIMNNKKKVEPYWDKVPYKYHWNMFRCYNEPCVIRNTTECLKYCNNINHVGSSANCRERCLKNAVQQFDYFKLNKYNFGPTMPMLRCGSLLNDNKGDYVLT